MGVPLRVWARFHKNSRKAALDLETVETFLAARDWNFPTMYMDKFRGVRRLFNKRAREGYLEETLNVKAQASQMLSLYKLFRHMVEVGVSAGTKAVLAEELKAFGAACRVIGLILLLKRARLGHTTHQRDRLTHALDGAVDVMVRLHCETYGYDMIRPKHHRMQHI